MQPPQAVVASTGRSGSGFTYKVLTELGINAGHESYFCFPWNNSKQVEVDSSWIATDQLDDYQGIVYHQTRNPLKVLTSLTATAKPWTPPVSKVWEIRKRMMPEVTGDLMADFTGMIWHMNKEIEKHSSWRYRIEDITAGQVQDIANAAGHDVTVQEATMALSKVSDSYNSHHSSRQLQWSDLDNKWKPKLQKMSKRYGY